MGNGFEPAVFSAEVAARPAVMLKVPLTSLARLRSGARWFYWVAGLSLVNTAAAFAGGHIHFVVGLASRRWWTRWRAKPVLRPRCRRW